MSRAVHHDDPEFVRIETELVARIRAAANEARRRIGNRPVDYGDLPAGGSLRKETPTCEP